MSGVHALQTMEKRQLALGTISFGVCFAAWGLIAAFAPKFREIYHLTASQSAFLVAVPVLLGALARIPMGLLTDRYKGRLVFSALMLLSALPALLVPEATSYSMLLGIGFLLGISGSSFAVGVGFVSPWFPREKQGSALGVYGLGNMGQSAAVFLGPLLALSIGWQNVFRLVAAVLVVWSVVFAVSARNAQVAVKPRSLGAMLAVLFREPLAWALSAFYFLTFGGFVAFSIYLPSFLKDEFQLTPADAGFRTAGFVVLATLLRPAGGWLADKIGGARVLSIVFLGVVPFALLLAWPSMLPFTVGALGCAALLGTGERRCVQTRSAIFSRGDRNRHRPGGRHGRTRRLLPAAAARRVSRSSGRHLARLRAAGPRRFGAVAIERTGLRAPGDRRRSAAHPRL